MYPPTVSKRWEKKFKEFLKLFRAKKRCKEILFKSIPKCFYRFLNIYNFRTKKIYTDSRINVS
jgi:hypothetical protein